MAALLTKFLPKASLTAVPETLPPMGVVDGQCFLPERAVISSRGHRQGRVGMWRISPPPWQAAARGSGRASAGTADRTVPVPALSLPSSGWVFAAAAFTQGF